MTDNAPPLADLSRLIRAGRRVLYLTGAGLSVASGIAPYRLTKDAVWNRFLTEWGTVAKFLDDPYAWWTQYWLQSHPPETLLREPNAGHHAIANLLAARPTDAVVTQNVDGLHAKTGLRPEQLIEVHGHMGRYRCLSSECELHRRPIFEVDLTCLQRRELPRCSACEEVVMPLCLFFDEHYTVHPYFRFFEATQLMRRAEAIVFVGTSFSVGITAMALEIAQERKTPMWNFNLYVEDGMHNVVGPAEHTLPALQLLCL